MKLTSEYVCVFSLGSKKKYEFHIFIADNGFHFKRNMNFTFFIADNCFHSIL